MATISPGAMAVDEKLAAFCPVAAGKKLVANPYRVITAAMASATEKRHPILSCLNGDIVESATMHQENSRMTFTSEHARLWKHPDYIAAKDRLASALAILETLEDNMYIFKTEPLDLEKIEKQKARVKAAKQARREVLIRLLAEQLKVELNLH
jgi:hypothetical protein